MRRCCKGLSVLLFASACVSTINDTTIHGRIAFDSDRTGTDEIFVIDPHGSNLRQLTHVNRKGVSGRVPDWSPDRKWIVFSSNRTGPWADLYIMDASGGNLHQLTNTPRISEANAAWSPDGRQIIYSAQVRAPTGTDGVREDREPAHIWIIDRDGSNARPLTRGSSRNIRPAWSPDGRTILFSSDRHAPLDPEMIGRDDGDLEIYRMARDGSNVRRLTQYEGTALGARYSPDGQRIVFQGFQPPAFSEILIMDANGSAVEHLTRGRFPSAGRPGWSPDGRELVFNFEGSIYVMHAEGGNPRKLTDNGRHPAWR